MTSRPVHENLRGAIRSAGLRATPSRIALLEALTREARPLSVRRLLALPRLKLRDPATVYRTVVSLTRAGVLREVDFRHGHAHYEPNTHDDHHHIVCLKCDRVADVRGCHVDRLTGSILRQSGFQSIRDHALEFFGLCATCARKAV